MSAAVIGAMLGLAAGCGLALALVRLPFLRRPTLEDRLAPYLRDTARPSRLLEAPATRTPFPTLERIIRPLLADGARVVERVSGSSASVRRRLLQAGQRPDVEAFRVEQLVWGLAALAAAVLLSVVSLATGLAHRPVALLMMCLLAALAGILLRDHWLSRQVSRREACILAEFPTIAELLALAVSAGEGPVAALERVAATSHGELARELRFTLADMRSGTTLVQALDATAQRSSLPAVARFVDGVAVAVDRGTPLADVLRAQATDVREVSKRALLEAGGRKEIAMMIPVVFFVLPVTVVFALFPGFFSLQLTTP